MNNEKEDESSRAIDGVEKPLKVIEGEGSGAEPKVVEKKKIFFFGQAGCLKNSPIKSFATPNHNNHAKPVDIPNAPSINEKESKVEEGKNAVASDDEADLMKKISEALEDDSEKSKYFLVRKFDGNFIFLCYFRRRGKF